jgi:hypothetical protein
MEDIVQALTAHGIRFKRPGPYTLHCRKTFAGEKPVVIFEAVGVQGYFFKGRVINYCAEQLKGLNIYFMLVYITVFSLLDSSPCGLQEQIWLRVSKTKLLGVVHQQRLEN